MEPKEKGAYLGIFVVFGILYIVKLITSNIFNLINTLATKTIIPWNLNTLIGFQLVPFLILALVFNLKLKTNKEFSRYYWASIIIAFLGEIFLFFYHASL